MQDFSELLDKYTPLTADEIVELATALAGKDRYDEDYIQYICYRLWKRQLRYDPKRGYTIGAFFGSIKFRLRTDYLRTYKPYYSYQGTKLKEDTQLFKVVHDVDYVTETISVKDDLTYVHLKDYIETLTDRQRLIVFQRVFLEMTLQEIGDFHGFSLERAHTIWTEIRFHLENLKSSSSPLTVTAVEKLPKSSSSDLKQLKPASVVFSAKQVRAA